MLRNDRGAQCLDIREMSNDALDETLDRVQSDLVSAWHELDHLREKLLRDPLNPLLPSELKAREKSAAQMEDRFRKINAEIYGTWYGIEQ